MSAKQVAVLQHESSSSEPPAAAQTRVTTEELAKALAALEARKQDGAQRLKRTVLIGNALKDLEVESTPDEVLAEVQAQRLARRDAAETTEPPQFSTALLWKLLPTIVGVTGVMMLPFLARSSRPPALPPVLLPPPVRPPAPSPVNPISLILDNTPFYCLPSEVEEIIQNEPLSQVSVITAPAFSPYAPWTLIKHHGKVYIEGWISKAAQPSLMTSGSAILYNFDPITRSRPGFVPVVLRVDRFEELGFYTRVSTQHGLRPTQHTDQMLAVEHVHLDAYAWP